MWLIFINNELENSLIPRNDSLILGYLLIVILYALIGNTIIHEKTLNSRKDISFMIEKLIVSILYIPLILIELLINLGPFYGFLIYITPFELILQTIVRVLLFYFLGLNAINIIKFNNNNSLPKFLIIAIMIPYMLLLNNTLVYVYISIYGGYLLPSLTMILILLTIILLNRKSNTNNLISSNLNTD